MSSRKKPNKYCIIALRNSSTRAQEQRIVMGLSCPRFRESIKVNVVLSVRYEGLVAQRLEQRTHNPLVPGSNPGGPTKTIWFSSAPLRPFSNSVANRCVRLVAGLCESQVILFKNKRLATNCGRWNFWHSNCPLRCSHAETEGVSM